MANYISTKEIPQTINDFLATTSRIVVILPFGAVQDKTLFTDWNLKDYPTVDFTLVLSGPFNNKRALALASVEPILQVQSVQITYHDEPLISRIVTDNHSLLLPNGLSETESDKAGVLSKLGIDHQSDIKKMEASGRAVYKKVANFKKKYFGLKKFFHNSSVIEETLGFDPSRQ